MSDIVYSDNTLAVPFNSCALDNPTNSTSCFQDSTYNDRLTFQITIDSNPATIKSALDSNPAEVKTASAASAIAAPVVKVIASDDQDDTVLIAVIYNCKSNDNGFVPVQLDLHFGTSPKDDLSIVWQKYCSNGVNDKMLYGYLTGDPDYGTVQLHEFGQDNVALVVVGPSDVSTEFFLKLDEPGANQAFMAPFIRSDFADIVSVTVRGNHPKGGIIEGLSITKFQIGYECLRRGEATIEATIAIPPFRNISAMWKKGKFFPATPHLPKRIILRALLTRYNSHDLALYEDCGGNTATNLLVGTEENAYDIVDNGEPTPQYMVGIDNIGTDHSEQHKHLPGNQSDWVFFVKNGDDQSHPESDTALHVGRVTATVEKPAILFPFSPTVMEKSTMSWKQIVVSSYVLQAGSSLKVSMPLICRGIGESRVLITVPVLGYRELEFGIAKECARIGASRRSEQFVFTVNNVFWLSVVFVMCGLAYIYVRSRRIKGTRYSPVSLTER